MVKRLFRHCAKPSSQVGVAAVEFGILIIPMLIMLVGVAEYGRAIYQYNTIVKSVRDATRYLTTVSPGAGYVEAKNLAVCGAIDCQGLVPVVPGLVQGMVKICDATTIADCLGVPHSGVVAGTGVGAISANLVTVKITNANNNAAGYVYQPMLPGFSIGGFAVGSITFDPIQNTMRQPL